MLKYFPCCKREEGKKPDQRTPQKQTCLTLNRVKLYQHCSTRRIQEYPDMNEELECGSLAWRNGERLQVSLEEKAPRTCGRQSGAQERSLDNSVIKCFQNWLYLCVQCVKCELHAQQGVRAAVGVSLLLQFSIIQQLGILKLDIYEELCYVSNIIIKDRRCKVSKC